MDALLQLIGRFFEDFVRSLVAFFLSAVVGTPFILIGAAFDEGSYAANVAARYGALWDWWLG